MTAPSVSSAPLLREARIGLPGAAVGIFELMLGDLALALTTMTLDDGRSWFIDALINAGDDVAAAETGFTTLVTDAAVIADIAPPTVTWRTLPDTDWVAETQKILHPLYVGRFWIHGPDHREARPVACLPLEIEAGLAFGTGRHATTAGCLLALEKLAKERHFQRIVDLGCGSGILAMGACRLWPATVWASDVDPVAVATARNNARMNSLPHAIRFVTSDGLKERRLKTAGPYDLIIANILASPLVRLAPEIAGALMPGGRVVLSGLLATQESLVLHGYRLQGLRLVSRIRANGWATLILAG